MLIKLINPNTTSAMTELMGDSARTVAAAGSDIVLATSRSGAASIEGHYDEALSILGVIDEIARGKPADAYIIGCFGDPGLLAAREITASPVLGVAESAMHAATFVATSFSIITTLERTRIISERLVRSYGMQNHCRSVRATDVPVLELERSSSTADAAILAECEKALIEDRAQAIVLGCAGMSNLVERLQHRLGVPVIDGVAAAVKFAEGIVGMGLRTSKVGDLAYPLPKAYAGKLAEYAPASLKLRNNDEPSALATAIGS
ncbi:aspartate/glutamate racemase family protein [Sinorhizobium meliloti]|uniref:aspartate/glutamate racemase family protein n=1 Tax=Rhizobium meliloti TaxID=382 RepID=UPI000FDA21F9|nr:aspartate/glutamate racemase family protein [Sinorhizobium meliloti]RVG22086.1 aspartate/glutamate racemase family protein [Sinorhizobium meliloti]RVN96520.1 aspartate/glutamate racemase family protein [Sinorhizobium meliloti]RVP66411.1 aspartate/glutamate racemase family protein [Sinorhizobium meliloti]